jgi:6-pyruvoyl-tetrahydropterin synthase
MMTIFISTQFEGIHRWPEAAGEFEYLKYPHRHMFYVEVEVEVTEENRQIEFLAFKKHINEYCEKWSVETTNSCETMAKHIAHHLLDIELQPIKVSVLEDNENGATWRKDA